MLLICITNLLRLVLALWICKSCTVKHSVSYQLTGRKSNPIFQPLKYLIEHTVTLI